MPNSVSIHGGTETARAHCCTAQFWPSVLKSLTFSLFLKLFSSMKKLAYSSKDQMKVKFKSYVHN